MGTSTSVSANTFERAPPLSVAYIPTGQFATDSLALRFASIAECACGLARVEFVNLMCFPTPSPLHGLVSPLLLLRRLSARWCSPSWICRPRPKIFRRDEFFHCDSH